MRSATQTRFGCRNTTTYSSLLIAILPDSLPVMGLCVPSCFVCPINFWKVVVPHAAATVSIGQDGSLYLCFHSSFMQQPGLSTPYIWEMQWVQSSHWLPVEKGAEPHDCLQGKMFCSVPPVTTQSSGLHADTDKISLYIANASWNSAR